MTNTLNDLETLLEEVFNDPSQNESFNATLLETQVFVLTPEPASEPSEKGDKVDIVNFIMQDGRPFIPIFTSIEEMQNSIDQDYGYMQLDGRNLLGLLRGSDVVINPASEYSMHLRGMDVEKLLDQSSKLKDSKIH